MKKIARTAMAAIAAGVVVFVISACGSSSPTTSSSTSTPSSTAAATSGPGLTAPTSPSGTKVAGGTVTFTEGPSAPPNYIFPMTSAQVCSTTNISQLNAMLYRPLYWFGNNYSPTVDYNYSVGQQPSFSNGDKTVTIKLNNWKWSDGESVTSRDIEFWINLYKADPAKNFCAYVPGYFPDNVKSVSTPNPQTVVLNLTKGFDPEWFQYNELSQIYPIPLSWDRTSLSQPAPKTDNGHLPDSTPKGAEAVYTFLDSQSKALGSWTNSPLWSVVDGPFKLQSFTSDGQTTLVPNPSYSGSPKPTISKFVLLPFTSDTAIYNEIRSGGPSAVTIGNLPAQYAPQIPTVKGEGYTYNPAASYSFNYFPLNLHNPTMGPVFSQVYFRQALQHLIDQQGWIKAFLNNTAVQTTSPIPSAPPSPLVDTSSLTSTNPFPFSTAAASQLLSSHGWKVVPGGTTTCQTPSLCGAGIKSGEAISFNLDYQAGVATLASEMNDLVAQAKKVGITINLTSHPFDTVISTAVACTASQPTCKWTAQNWGAGWIYGPDFLPTGETLFAPGASANYGSYNDPTATKLIDQTVYGPLSQEKQSLTAYAKYLQTSLPVVYGPTSIGSYQGDAGTLVSGKLGGYAANALGYFTPENWYLVK